MILGRSKKQSGVKIGSGRGFFTRGVRRRLMAGGALVLTGAVAAAAIWGENSPYYGKVQASMGEFRDALAHAAGFQVREILVVGRDATPRQTVLAALGSGFGDPIIGVDLQAARDRMLTLPWIKSAAVERVLPDTLIVRLTERRPIALWQHSKQYSVIDHEGNVLANDMVAAYPHLLVVAGDDAPQHAGMLIDMLRSEPELMARVESAMWVGRRRWNVFLNNGISIRLPEEGSADAWHRLAEYERMHALLGKNIRAVDMRLPDKLILQSRGPEEALPDGGPDQAPTVPGGSPSRKPTAGRSAQGRISRGRGRRSAATQSI